MFHGVIQKITLAHFFETWCSYTNLEKFLKMKEVFKTIQLVACSLTIDVTSFCKWVGLATNLFWSVMIWLHQLVSRSNNTIYLSVRLQTVPA